MLQRVINTLHILKTLIKDLFQSQSLVHESPGCLGRADPDWMVHRMMWWTEFNYSLHPRVMYLVSIPSFHAINNKIN